MLPLKKGRVVLMVSLWGALVFSPFQKPVIAQTSSSETPPSENELNKGFFLNFGEDFREVITSPVNWQAKDILTFSAILGAGAILYACDGDIYDGVQSRRSHSSLDASPYISKLGHGAYLLGFMAVLYASGEIGRDNSLRKTALLSLESFLTTSFFVFSLKFLTGRARPYAEETSRAFHPLSFKSRYQSFPSGDAAGAFAVATTIAEQAHRIYVDVLVYSLASMVAFYRVHDRKHWPSDVFVGSAFGYFVAKKISRLNQSQNPGKVNASFQVTSQSQSFTLSIYF